MEERQKKNYNSNILNLISNFGGFSACI